VRALPYDSISSCISYIWTQNGVTGFYRGLVRTRQTACYLKVIPSVALAFAFNEQLKKWLKVG
jgi:hypothetical protein